MQKSFLPFFFLSTFWISPALHASDLVYPGGGVLAQIVDGGGTKTTITLINLDPTPAPYTLNFYDDNGNALSLTTTAGTGAVLSGTLNAGGSTIIQTNGTSKSISQGWALLVTNNTIAGSAVFGLPFNNNVFVEASCPLDTGVNSQFGLPFDLATAVTGVALANTYQNMPLTVSVTVNDLNGNKILTDTLTLPGYGHTSFMLTDKYPQLANQKGFVVFSGGYYMNVLGLRATSTTFTSITPIVASGW